MTRLSLGASGERLARTYLEEQGLRFRAANVRELGGELDLIMEDLQRNELVFVEVRTRQGGMPYGPPEESLTAQKRHALQRSILSYLTRTGWTAYYRLDLVGITFNDTGIPRVTHTEYVALE